MAQPKVFVSHSHVDDAFAERLVNDLRVAGADAWLDKEDLGVGDFQARIDAALANCEWFVLVLTLNALSSPWVRQEVRAANRLKHKGQISDLIFIQAGPVEQDELPAMWGVYNIFNATMNYAIARDRALVAVGLQSLDPHSGAIHPMVDLRTVRVCYRCGKPIDPTAEEPCSYHPSTARLVHSGSDPRTDYRDYYTFYCCGRSALSYVGSDGSDYPPKRWPGCKNEPSHIW